MAFCSIVMFHVKNAMDGWYAGWSPRGSHVLEPAVAVVCRMACRISTKLYTKSIRGIGTSLSSKIARSKMAKYFVGAH
jgi:hypothetical protein